MLEQPRPRWVQTLQTSTIPYFVVTLAENADSPAVDDRLRSIVFRRGQIHVAGLVVQAPQFRGDSVAWSQTSTLGFSSGHLYYGREGTELQGFVAVGESAATAAIFHVTATAVPFGTFRTLLTKAGGEPLPGPTIRLGYRPDRRMDVRPAVIVDGIDLTGDCVFALEGDEPALTVDLTRGLWEDLRGLARVRFRVDPVSGVGLSGTLTRIADDEAVHQLAIDGELYTGEASLDGPEAVPLIYTANAVPTLEAALAAADTLTSDDVKTLYACLATVPDDTELGQRTFQYMQDNMHWAMWQDTQADEIARRRKWLETYYNRSEPTISEMRQASIRRNLGWYNDTMAVALMAQGVASMPANRDVVPRPIGDHDKATINTFVQKCLPQSDVFHSESELVWRDAYLKASTGLKRYVDDDEGIRAAIQAGDTSRRTWATRIREYFTTPEQLQIITTALFSEVQSAPGELAPRSSDELAAQIAEVSQRLAQTRGRLDALTRNHAAPDAVAPLEQLAEAQQQLVDAYKAQQRTLSLAICKSTATIKNVSSLLKALDPTYESSQLYANQAGAAVLATTAAHADVDGIPDYGATLERMLEKFFADLTAGRLDIFEPDMNAQLASQMRDMMARERLDAKTLARKMNTVLTNARGQTFLERTGAAARSFATEHPSLTAVFRIAMVAAYAYTVVRVLQLIGKDAGHVSTFDQATFYMTMSMLSVETIRSLIPNVRAFLESTKSVVAEAVPGVLAEWWGRFTAFTGDLMGRMSAGLARLAARVGRLATSVLESSAVTWVITAVKTVFSAITRLAGEALAPAGSVIARAAVRIADWFKDKWVGFCRVVSKGFEVLSKVVTIVAVVWSTIVEGIDCVRLWMSDRQLGAKILTTIGFIATVAAGFATIAGMFSTTFAWSGIGVIVGLIAFGLAVLVQILWKPESPLQKLIDRVLLPFIHGPAASAVARLEPAAATGVV